jgi:hypothetical protein
VGVYLDFQLTRSHAYIKKYFILFMEAHIIKKGTHWVLGEILFLQILKGNIGQEKKVEERLVPLDILKKLISNGFLRNMIFLWRRMLYWV